MAKTITVKDLHPDSKKLAALIAKNDAGVLQKYKKITNPKQ
jgi:hypothetical protein